MQDENYSRIVIVESSDVKDNNNGTKYSVMGIDKEGNAHAIDSLEQTYGNNSTREYNEVNRDGTEIESESQKSIFKIKGNDEGEIAIKNGDYGTLDVSYMRTARSDRQDTLGVPIETRNTRYTTKNVRETMNRNKNARVNDEAEKIEQTETIDDLYVIEKATLEYNKTRINKIVEKIMNKNEEYGNVYNRQDVYNKVINQLDNSNDNDLREDEIITNVCKDLDKNINQRTRGENKNMY